MLYCKHWWISPVANCSEKGATQASNTYTYYWKKDRGKNIQPIWNKEYEEQNIFWLLRDL
jgi:hypothetical protein